MKYQRALVKYGDLIKKALKDHQNIPEKSRQTEIAKIIVQENPQLGVTSNYLRNVVGAYLKLNNSDQIETSTDTSTSGYDSREITDRLRHECWKYGLPVEAVSSYKWVNHNGQEALNIAFHPEYQADQRKAQDFLEDLEARLKKKFGAPAAKVKLVKGAENVLFVNIADLHVGMDPNEDGLSLWDADWDEEDIMNAANEIIEWIKHEAELYRGFDLIIVNLLGDLVDGFNKKTTRGGHEMPQKYNNVEQADICVAFLYKLIKGLKEIGPLLVKATSNSNHGGDFEHLMLQRFQLMCKYELQVDMELTAKMALGYLVPGTDQPVAIAHGKDKKFAERGLPAFIQDSDDYKVEAIIKAVHPGFKSHKKPIFFKADTHQHVDQDKKNFRWVACASCCPDSDWAKNNFYRAAKGACTYGIYNISKAALKTGLIDF